MDQIPVLLRIIVAEDDIWKISLNKKPDSLEELVVQLKDLLSLPYDFKLQYEDQDFHLLCNFTDIADLPEKATLKIIHLVTLSLTILPSHTTRSDNEGSPLTLMAAWQTRGSCQLQDHRRRKEDNHDDHGCEDVTINGCCSRYGRTMASTFREIQVSTLPKCNMQFMIKEKIWSSLGSLVLKV